MSELIQKKLLRLKLLTPVHISDGSEGEVTPIEYVITESGQLHKVNLARVLPLLPEDSLAELTGYLEAEDLSRIRDFIQSLWQKREDMFADCIEYSMDAGDIQDFYRNLRKNEASQLMITPFVRSGGRVYMPGSSIKGSMRTAFINELLTAPISFRLSDREINKKAKELEEDTLRCSYVDSASGRRKVNIAKDPFKALKVSDSFVLLGNTIVKKIAITRKDAAGGFDFAEMKGVKVFGEFIRRGVELDIEVRLDTRYYGTPKAPSWRISFEGIVDSCKAFYRRVLEHEKNAFFTGFDEKVGTSKISKLYDELLRINNEPNTFLLRIGKHSGRNSLSFNLRNQKGIEPKSRQLIVEDGEYWPVGWVSVTGA